MKSIPTEFNGITFRSRTEARWAIFMRNLGVKYDYEAEGYDLDGLHYLPDFWLPDLKAFLEIKPEAPNNQEMERALRLANYTKRKIFIQSGSPRLPDLADASDSMRCIFPGESEDVPYWWCECLKCGKIGIEFRGRTDRLDCVCNRDINRDDRCYGFDTARLLVAYDTAKAYQFWAPEANA